MKPGEYKTVQARILAYAEAIGWTVVPREEAEERRAPVESLVFEHQAEYYQALQESTRQT